MNFVLASDDNYVPFLSVTLVSLIEHNKNNSEPLYIYILNDNISKSNKNHIKSLIKDDNTHLEFIETKKLDELEVSLLGMEKSSHLSFTTYARLFLDTLLPKEIDKIIYIDCDALVLGSFEELWNMDLKDNYLGAVLDPCSTYFKESLGVKVSDKYFNAGVLFINLKKWREENIEQAVVDFVRKNQSKLFQHDQTIINNIFKNKIAVIDPKYNIMGAFTFLDYDSAIKLRAIDHEYYDKKTFNRAVKDPVFIHLFGQASGRPWANKYHPYRKKYEKYVELAGYSKDEIFDREEIPLKAKVYNKALNYPKLMKFLLKACPNSIIQNRDRVATDKGLSENLKVKSS